MTTADFILKYRTGDVAKAALLVRQYSEVDHEFALRQIEGWQKACTKLPEISKIEGWHYPIRLSMEQCSSELTAKYKRSIIDRLTSQLATLNPQLSTTLNPQPSTTLNPQPSTRITDLTGGFGIDAYYMGTTDYVEQNAELCAVVAHNMELAGRPTRIHNTTAEAYLASIREKAPLPSAQDSSKPTSLLPSTLSLVYLDPARRDSHGGKVFRLEDCTPNVVDLYSTLMSRCDVLLLKLSPMLDITEALRRLPDAREVHVVAVKNEVKEVLILCHNYAETLRYICVNLDSNDPVFQTNSEADRLGQSLLNNASPFNNASWLNMSSPLAMSKTQTNNLVSYLYEPNAAIMKAGLFYEVSLQYGLVMLAENSHLYTSDIVLKNFPGRIWTAHKATKDELKNLSQANILTRNYPLKPEDIKKKYRLRDGGTTYLIGTRTISGPTLFIAERLR